MKQRREVRKVTYKNILADLLWDLRGLIEDAEYRVMQLSREQKEESKDEVQTEEGD